MTRRRRPRKGTDRSTGPPASITRGGVKFVYSLDEDCYVVAHPSGRLDPKQRLSPGQLPKETSEFIYGPDEDLDEEQKR